MVDKNHSRKAINFLSRFIPFFTFTLLILLVPRQAQASLFDDFINQMNNTLKNGVEGVKDLVVPQEDKNKVLTLESDIKLAADGDLNKNGQIDGIQMNFKSFKKKIIAIIIPFFILVVGYMLFLKDYNFDFANPLKIILDFGYPLGEAIYISIAIITFIFSRTILDGIMRSKALWILIALFIQFIADYAFLYTIESYTPGNFLELIYLTAYFVMTLALLSFRSIQIKVKSTQ